MEYPIYIDGAECGSVSVTKAGLYTCFSADCAMKSGIVRLYIYGGGKTEYLGTLSPCNGRLCLEKRFSPSEMRGLPSNIEYAANIELRKLEEKSTKNDEELLWFQTENGNLTAFDGEKSLVAIPTSATLRGCRTMKIGDRDYMIFVSKRNLR